MYSITLQNTPNQEFTVELNGSSYRIWVRTIQDLTFMSVWQDDILLFYNQLCLPNSFVNPYNYVSSNGKFYFSCITDDYPNYNDFGKTVTLLFYTPDEAEQYERT